MPLDFNSVHKSIEENNPLIQEVIREIQKRVIGQRDMIRRLLIGIFTGGHILLEGIPGLA